MRYNNLILLFALSLSSIGCQQTYLTVDPSIQPYFDRFHARFGIYPYGVHASLSYDLGGAYGKTFIRNNSKSILVLESYWAIATDGGKENLIYHEIGHALFRLQHNDIKDIFGCPISIMHSKSFGDDWCYAENRFQLLNQFEALIKNYK